MSIYHRLKAAVLYNYKKIELKRKYDSLTILACTYYLVFSGFLFSSPFTMTTIKGTDYGTSMKQVYDVIMKKPLQFLVLITVSIFFKLKNSSNF